MPEASRPVALVTGVGRTRGIGFAIAESLAASGWDVAVTWWSAYDTSMPWGADPVIATEVTGRIEASGGRCHPVQADLTETGVPARLFDEVEQALGPVSGLVLNHTVSIESALLDTTTEAFRAHLEANVVANWSLIREFGLRFPAGSRGRIVSLTSDHVVGNLPYGASKAAADRVALAAAYELGHLGITANVVNPGPTDTGWMDDASRSHAAAVTALPRPAVPQDAANLVAFLCSEQGGWITGQLLYSNGGFRGSIP